MGAKEELDNLWQDEKNWKGRLLYYCPTDPRVMVSKRPKWTGWTVNFANRSWPLVLVILSLIVVGPVCFLLALGVKNIFMLIFVLTFSIVVVCLLSHHLSNRTS